MDKANRKRLIITAVYLTFFALVGWGLYEVLRPMETCQDKIKNQNETGVDCGGICGACKVAPSAQALITGDAGIVNGGISGQYDFYAIVTNPNNVYGSSSFNYHIKIKDAAGAVMEERKGKSYILPGERKYVVETNFKPSSVPGSYEFAVSDPVWVEFTDYYEKPEIKIVNRNYTEIKDGVGFSEVTGLLKNDSPFDFNLIRIRVVLKNAERKIVALNYTEMGTVRSKEERDFRAFWPSRFPGEVADVEAEVEVNIFDSQIFTRQFLKN